MDGAGPVRVGLFGGTFDPPHVGHLVGASEAAAVCRLDEVIFVVAGQPWQKAGRTVPVSSAEDRYAMTVLAAEPRADFQVSRMEIERTGPSHTLDTLEALAGAGRTLVFIAGADALSKIDTWEQPDRVRALTEFAVLHRRGADIEGAARALAGTRWQEVPMPLIEVSSTAIRRRVAEGRPISFLVPRPVEDHIRSASLYAPVQREPFLYSSRDG